MAIGTLAAVLAGMQAPVLFTKAALGTGVANKCYSYWGGAGAPGGGAFDTTLNGVVLSASSGVPAGAIPHYDPPGGTLAYLARLTAVANSGGMAYLCDRLWHNGNIVANSGSAQNIVSPSWPTRDADGTSNGKGVFLGLEVSGAMGANVPTIAVSYTNSTGAAGRAGAHIDAPTASAIVASFYRIGVQGGDMGVRSVESLTFGGTPWASGTCNLVAYRILAALELSANGMPNAIDPITGGLPQLYNGTCPFWIMLQNGGTALQLHGTYTETWG